MTLSNTLAALVAERDAAAEAYAAKWGKNAMFRDTAANNEIVVFMRDNAPAIAAQLQQRDKLVEAVKGILEWRGILSGNSDFDADMTDLAAALEEASNVK